MSRPGDEPAFEEQPLVQEAIEDDTTVPGLEAPGDGPDPDTARFQEPGEPPLESGR